jgi:hypothetical protein
MMDGPRRGIGLVGCWGERDQEMVGWMEGWWRAAAGLTCANTTTTKSNFGVDPTAGKSWILFALILLYALP